MKINLHFNRCLHVLIVFCLATSFSDGLYAADTPRFDLGRSYGGKGWGFADGPLDDARFNQPLGMDRYSDNVLLVADTFNHCMRLIDMREEQVSTVMGICGEEGATGEAEDLKEFLLDHPADVAVDRRRNIYYIADTGNRRVLEVKDEQVTDIELSASPERQIIHPLGLSVDFESGDLFIADSECNCIFRYDYYDRNVIRIAGSGEGGYDPKIRNAETSRLDSPSDCLPVSNSQGLAALYVTDSNNDLLRWLRPGENVPWLISNYAGAENLATARQKPGAAAMFSLDHPYRLASIGNALSPILVVTLPTQRSIVAITNMRYLFIAAGEGASGQSTDIGIPYAICSQGDRLWLFDSDASFKSFDLVYP